MRAAFPQHWRVEDGELVNDGTGPYATTEREFGDHELLVDSTTVPGADSGIYLRGMPQVQIWDSTQPFDPARPTRPFLVRGPIMLQTHGGEFRWRNLFIREIDTRSRGTAGSLGQDPDGKEKRR